MDVDAPAGGASESKTSNEGGAAPQDKDKEGGEGGGEGNEEAKQAHPEPEPTSLILGNPARVTLAQEPLVSFNLDQRYVPVRRSSKPIGIVVLLDKTPGEPEDVADVESPPLEGDEDEAEPPEPFEWSPPN